MHDPCIVIILGVPTEDMSLYQYKLIGSENLTSNGQLLQLLESK